MAKIRTGLLPLVVVVGVAAMLGGQVAAQDKADQIGALIPLSGPNSAIARWIEEYRVGWILTRETLPKVAEDLRRLSTNPSELVEMRSRCFQVYQQHFSKPHLLNRWNDELRAIVGD